MPETTEQTPKPRTWLPRAMWSGGILLTIGLWLVGCGGYPFIQWSPLNCKHEDIDIRTGRIRTTRVLLWMKVREATEDSALTKVLTAEDLRGAVPEWRRVNTFSPGVHYSPHYGYHAAIHQVVMLEEVWSRFVIGPEVKREVALVVLGLWKEKGNYHAAGDYVNEFCRRLYALGDNPPEESVRSAAAEALKKIRGEESGK